MAEFDPYYKWFGIPAEEQPPNYYRLLAIDLFESDADVIDAAAEQRMTFLRSHSSGDRILIAQRLLNEVAAARLCLSKPERRDEYNARLRAKNPGDTVAIDPASIDLNLDSGPSVIATPKPRPRRSKPATGMTWKVVGGSIAVVILVAIVVIAIRGSGDRQEVKETNPRARKKKSIKAEVKKKPAGKMKQTGKKKNKKRDAKKSTPTSQDDSKLPLNTRGLVAHFPFDEFAGSKLYDATARTRQHRFAGKPNWSVGKIGGALALTGNAQVEFDVFRSRPRLTYCLWVCPTSSEKMTILSQLADQDEKVVRGHRLEIEEGKLIAQFADRFPKTMRIIAIKPIELHRWHHVTVVYNGGRGIRAMQMYLDGALWPTLITHQNLPQRPAVLSRFRVGQASGSSRFVGAIDELRFYALPLRENQIALIAKNRFIQARQLLQSKKTSLLELQPAKMTIGQGNWNQNSDVSVRGIKPDKLVWAPPKLNGDAAVASIEFPLSSRFGKFIGAVALGDKSPSDSVATFFLEVDGRQIWKSRQLAGPGDSQRFNVPIDQLARKLTLRVQSRQATVESLWFDPQLVR